jgi:PAS domain S-box-containing protein
MRRVLIVDDNEENLYYLQALLPGEGYAVESARHGAEALVRARQAPPDVIISDLLMPVMDGYTLLRRWKTDEHLKDVPFIVYTATYTEPEDERLALSLGADAFILKPAEPDALLAQIRAVLAAGRGAASTLAPESISDEAAILQSYSETLIRKLEQKTMQLEEANRALQKDIAAREQTEVALRASEAQFSSAFSYASAGMSLQGLDGRYLKVNRALCSMLGYSEAELLVRTFQDLTHPEDQEESLGEMRKLMAGEIEFIQLEKRYLHRETRVIWAHISVSLLRDEAGVPLHFIAQIQDITVRKQAEEMLRKSEERYRRLIDTANEGVWTIDTKGRTTYVNQRMADFLGYTPAEMMGRIHTDFMWEEDRLKGDLDLELRRHGVREIWDQRYRRKDGRELWTVASCNTMFDADGTFIGALGMFTDITERKQIEGALHRSEALFRTLVQTSWDGFHLVKLTGEIIYESPAVTRMLGYEPEEMVGRSVLEFMHPEDAAALVAGASSLAETPGKLRTVTLRVRHKDGAWRYVESYEVNLLEHPDVGAIAVNYRDITERRDAELTARRLAAVVQSSADAIIGNDLNCVMTSWNAGAERIFGFTEREMVGTSVTRLMPPDRHGEKDRVLSAILRGENIADFETKRLTKAGRLIDVSVTASPILAADGKIVGVSKFARDITARKSAETAAANLLAVLEASLNEIFIFDAETKQFEYVNEAALRNLGYSMEEVRRLTPIDLTPDFELEAFGAMTEPLRSYEKSKLVFETMHRRADGTLYPIEAHMQLVERSDRSVFLVVGNDISERQRTASALRESEAEFRALAEAMPQMVWITNGDGLAIYQNHQWLDYTGILAEENLGNGWLAAVHPDDQARVAAKWQEAMTTGSCSMEYRIRRADGVFRWWLVRGEPQCDAAGEIRKWFGTCTDIHDLKQADLEIQHLNSDLERRVAERTAELHAATEEAEKANRAKSDFLSRTSHELRTPLNAILGFGQLLELEGRDPEEADNIEQILRAGRHLLGLINEMLDISRIEAGELELALHALPLNETIDEALALVRPMAIDRGVTLDRFESDSWVIADRQRFKQVVLNLLSNAVKYNCPSGRVTCTATELAGERVRVSVSDTGIGIAPADASKVFTAFERFGPTAMQIEGLGLGLAITRQLTELMGGRIGFESVLNEGSTFWVDLPLARVSRVADVGSAAATDFPTLNAGGHSCKVLYIEDNVSNLRLVTRILARRPAITFISATHGALGLEMAREYQPDLILLDLHLPDIQGDEVLCHLIAEPATANIPVVMLSADALPLRRKQLLAAGARAFLSKPLEVRALLATIDQFLAV